MVLPNGESLGREILTGTQLPVSSVFLLLLRFGSIIYCFAHSTVHFGSNYAHRH